jgi:iron complex transport system substrate-binding protein
MKWIVVFVAAFFVSGVAGGQSKPLRLVTLAPSLTELVFAAGAGDLLVGASAFSDFPDAAKSVPQIANAAGVNWEALIALRPDLVLVWDTGTRAADVERFATLGIRTLTIGIARVDEVPLRLRAIGEATGRTATANRAAQAFEASMSAIVSAQSGKARMPVFIAIAEQPLLTVNRDHYLSDIASRCGGDNVFANLTTLVGEPSREALVAAKPHVILRAKSDPSRMPTLYDGVAAFKAGRVGTFTADTAFRPGPRLIEALREVCAALDRARRSLSRN